MSEKLWKAWLAEKEISLEQGFAECLQEYALKYKKNRVSVSMGFMQSWDVRRWTSPVGRLIPVQCILSVGMRSVPYCTGRQNYLN